MDIRALTCSRSLLAALILWLPLIPGLAAAQSSIRAPGPPIPSVGGPFGGLEDPEDFEERAIITAERGIFMTDDQTGYGQGRTTIVMNQFELQGDRVVIDFISGDLQCEGNVIFKSPNEFIRASKGRFNLVTGEGVAYEMDGQSGDFYFRTIWDETENGPGFHQIDEQMSVYRGTYFTTSVFPVPQYYIASSEVIFIKGKRVFFRHPVLWVRGIPMFYFPFYTRDLEKGSPWYIIFGYGTRFGTFARIGYRYVHRVQTPNWVEQDEYDPKSEGQADFWVDLMSKRGEGAGLEYSYMFDYYRHTGYLQVYGIRDSERDVEDEDENKVWEFDRWVYRHKHFSQLLDQLYFQMDIDWASDPDIYYDVLDRFRREGVSERGRLFEQRARIALTYRTRDEIARIAFEQRDRLHRDRYTDFSDPFSDDLDFDPDPDFLDETRRRFRDDGISRDRYATITHSVYLRYSTRLLNLRGLPLYYRFEANAFNARDAGHNQWNREDDTRVRGGDIYGSLTHRLRLGPRTTWTNTAGIGAARYNRASDELVDRKRFERIPPFEEFEWPEEEDAPPVTSFPLEDGSKFVEGSRFRDPHTILLGQSETERDMRDADPNYYFADYMSRLNHRFTDFLDGYLKYFIRKGTGDSLGEFYESVGRVEATHEIYDFYTDRHYIEGGLNFYLRYPNLFASLIARQNLDSGSDVYPNEQLRFIGYFMGYVNQSQEFEATLGVGYEERQIRDRNDPFEFVQPSLGGMLMLSYYPRHDRYWARLDINGSHKLKDDPIEEEFRRDERQRRRFDENRTDITIRPTIGRQFGRKYRLEAFAEYNTRYEDFRRFGLGIRRDMADAELLITLAARNNAIRARRDELDDEDEFDERRETEYEFDFQVSLLFKINRDEPGLGQRSQVTLDTLRRDAQFVR